MAESAREEGPLHASCQGNGGRGGSVVEGEKETERERKVLLQSARAAKLFPCSDAANR
jgi:hypothetical protein